MSRRGNNPSTKKIIMKTTSLPTGMSSFLEQNTLAAATMTPSQVGALKYLAGHHSGGLYVISARYGDDNLFVKMHDSWGDDDSVVVHVYDPDDEEPEELFYFETGAEAAAKFIELMGIELPAEEAESTTKRVTVTMTFTVRDATREQIDDLVGMAEAQIEDPQEWEEAFGIGPSIVFETEGLHTETVVEEVPDE